METATEMEAATEPQREVIVERTTLPKGAPLGALAEIKIGRIDTLAGRNSAWEAREQIRKWIKAQEEQHAETGNLLFKAHRRFTAWLAEFLATPRDMQARLEREIKDFDGREKARVEEERRAADRKRIEAEMAARRVQEEEARKVREATEARERAEREKAEAEQRIKDAASEEERRAAELARAKAEEDASAFAEIEAEHQEAETAAALDAVVAATAPSAAVAAPKLKGSADKWEAIRQDEIQAFLDLAKAIEAGKLPRAAVLACYTPKVSGWNDLAKNWRESLRDLLPSVRAENAGGLRGGK